MRRRFCLILWLSLAAAVLAAPISSDAQIICISNNIPPPELPDYDQPPLPAPGYLWIPGYWAGGPNGYFWVPGTWELPPAAGLLWTPGYWGWRDGVYIWTAGYWGPHVGFYGGINYGFGYTGVGYEGGRWENGVFFYNRTVNNFVGVTITNVYEKTVVVDVNAPRVAFNGGSGGTTTRPTPQEEAAAREQRVATLPTQLQHERVASANKALLASENHGRPAIAATAKPGEFTGKGVVATKEPGTTPAVPAATRPSAAEPLNRAKEERPGEQRATTTPGMSAPSKPRETETEHRAPAAKPQSQSPPPKPSAQSAIKPAPSPPPPPSNPAPAAAKPAPPPPPPPSHPAPAAAKPAPPSSPACPPGKHVVEVNGHPTCK